MKYFRLAMLQLLLASSLQISAQPGGNDSLLTIVREDKHDVAEARALITLAGIYARTDLSKAKTFLYRSIALASASNFPVQLSAAYTVMASLQQDMGRTDSAEVFIHLLKQLSDSKPELRVNYVQAAGLFYKRQQNFRAAMPFLLEALDKTAAAARADPSPVKRTALAGATLNAGNNASVLGDYQAALRYHLDALRLFEALDNKKGISFAYQNIGEDFLDLNQLKKASEYTQRALTLKREGNDQRGVATSLKQMGSICRYAKQMDSALDYYSQSLQIDQQMDLKVEVMNLDLDIGNVYKDKKDRTNARLYFRNGRTLARQLADTGLAATFDAALISLDAAGKTQRRKEQRLLGSLASSIEAGDKGSQLLTYQYLAEHYAATGESEKALAFSRKYYEMNDSLQSLNVQVQLKKIEAQYALEKKEQEIALLKKDQQLSHLRLEKQQATLAKQRVFQFGAALLFFLLLLIGFLVFNRYRIVHRARRIIELEKMRNHIARDLHDDIGSTLSSINILSKVALQSRDDSASSLRKIMDRSSAIMEKMDDIVWTINPRNDTMEQLVCRMKEFAGEMLEPLNIVYSFEEQGDLPSLRLDIRHRKDLYLLFKEAVNNAAKYSQCRHLHILLRRAKDSLQMEIADDGKGFAEDGLRNGNGLKNMRDRAASMPATIRIDSAIGQGTRIDLDVPVL
ncbi:MAG TPA: tetratricopeptide repeat protein [Puia sp.]|nr:tetratricopeptide repeat protein [Puia sp.]